jgi:sulfotransferase family protein
MSSGLLFLWGTPRSMSTAFLRMMLERGDHEVFHEPFSSIVVRGWSLVGDRTATSHDELLKLLEERACEHPVFVKETTEYDYLTTGGDRIPEVGRHTFIIRDPRRVIPSHYAMNPDMVCDEIGYGHQMEMARRVRAVSGVRPHVVEAEDLLTDARGTVSRFCEYAGIPFLESSLSWQPGDQEVWSRTSQWHRDAAGSSGFARSSPSYESTVDNDRFLYECYWHHRPHYNVLRKWARSYAVSAA